MGGLGRSTSYRAMGTGAELVLAHGLGETLDSWLGQQRALGGDYRSYAYDIRGHGDSPLGRADGTMDQLGDDLIDLLEFLGPSPRILVGYSLGGTIVLSVAVRRPDLVSGVVAVASSSVVGSRAVEGYRESIDLVRSGDADAIRRSFREHVELCVHDPSSFDLDAMVEHDMAILGDGAGYNNACEAIAGLRDRPLNPLLSEVKAPVLLVGGEFDAFCPRKAQDIMLAALPDARYVEVKGVGHLLPIEDPDALTAALREFLVEAPR
jgi:3-oxoadipate enol-lactonase